MVFGQRSQLWWDLPMLDGFDLLADIYRVEPARYRRRRDELVAMLRLEPLLDQPVRQLSLGQRMRAEFAAALLHDPAILFLDEPTIGLDAPSKLAVREFVRRLNREQGVTVLLTTHDMHDVEALAERVIVIGQGRLLADGPFEALRASVLAERRLYIDFAGAGTRVRDTRRHGSGTHRTLARARLRPVQDPDAQADRRDCDRARGRGHPCRRTRHRGGDRAFLRPARRPRGVTMQSARPYLAAFRARFQLMLQYRAAALAGFATQCWWGAIRIMVFAAFYGVHAAAAPISLADAVTYVWLGQALLALLPWVADPEIGQAVRTGGVGYDRLRPLDAYGYWYARTLGWMLARALPRAVLMLLAAGIVLPLAGLGAWAWRPPSGVAAALLFVPAFALMTALGGAVLMLANVVVAASLNERGVNAVLTPLVIVFSGSLLPLDFFPDALRPFLHVQPFAGLVDIPFRIYFADLAGGAALQGLALQAGWTLVLVGLGRLAMERMMRRLEMQGG